MGCQGWSGRPGVSGIIPWLMYLKPPHLTAVPVLTNTPHSHGPKSSGEPSQNTRRYYNRERGGLNLEWEVQQSHMGVMVKRPHTFGHTAYMQVCKVQVFVN